MKNFSHELADTIRGHLDDMDWKYTWDEEDGIIHYSVGLKGCRLHSANALLAVRGNSFSTYTICPLSGSPDDRDGMLALAEFFSRANYGLTHGNFEFDFRDGEIRYKVTIDCDGVLPSRQMVRDAVNIPISMFQRYGDGITAVLFGMKSAEEAVKDCEKSSSDLLSALRSLGDAPDGLFEGLRALLEGHGDDDGEDEVEDSDSEDDSDFLAS